MAGFLTHVSVSGAIGIGVGALGYATGLPMTTALVGAGLCTIGGMLPDMDGDTGVAVREIVPLVAAVIPVLMLDLFKEWGFSREMIFLAVLALYFLIRFGIGTSFKRLTRHRGMWHSLPAALNVGLICFLICSYQDLGPRFFKSSMLSLGFVSHLILDELWSMKWLTSKKSSGTAFKFYDKNCAWSTVLTYGITIGLLAFIGLKDPTLSRDLLAWKKGEIEVISKPDWSRFLPSKAEGGTEVIMGQPEAQVEEKNVSGESPQE